MLGLVLLACLPTQPMDTTLYLPLDGSCRPAVGSGVRVEGEARYQAGVAGQGLVVGDGACRLIVPVAGNLRPEAGSIAMWIKPLDWRPDDGKFHVFFEAKGPGWLLLYKYYEGRPRILLLLSDDVQAHGWQYAAADIGNWQPGQWHHVVGTWDWRQACIYLDGQLAATLDNPPVPAITSETLTIGDEPWHIKRDARSVIDEVYVFGRPLRAEEVAALYRTGRQGRPAPRQLAKIAPLELHLSPEAWRERCVIAVDAAGLSPEKRREARIVLSLVRPKGEEAWGTELACRGRYSLRVEAPMFLDEPGRWLVKARAEVGGEVVARAEAPLELPDLSWRGSDLFEKLEVLPPWTPLRVGRGGFAVWGRTYHVTPLGAAQVRALGRALLAGPCRLEAVVDGRRAAMEAGRVRLEACDEAYADFAGRGRLGPIEVRARLHAEFDGMLRVDLQLSSERPVEVSELRLVIPLRASQATLYHFAGKRWAEPHAGAVPAEEGVTWASTEFLPFVWVGNEDCGLMWFCESDYGWSVADGAKLMRIERRGGEVRMVIEPISRPMELEKWRWTYGLMATPVKPLPRDWRKWRLQPGVRANVWIVWPGPQIIKYFGYPWPTDPDKFKQLVEEKHRAGIKVVPYSCLTFLSSSAPEWKLFGRAWWVTGVADQMSGDVMAYKSPFMCVCPRAEGWADFVVWANYRYMREFNLDGLYHDCTFPYACYNPIHGCGWVDEKGHQHRIYPIFAHRNLYRRIYAMMKSLGRETYMISHMSGRVTMPVLSFTDAYLDGEQFRGRQHYVRDYRDVMTLDYFRGEFMGRQWGLMPVFLPELAEDARTRKPTRGLLAFTVLHDVPVWAIWCDTAAVDEVRRVLDRFDYVRADFIPYWEGPVATGDAAVKASAYRRAGRALLVVSNFARRDKEVALVPDWHRLGLNPDRTRVFDAETGEQLSVQDGGIVVRVPEGDLKLIWLQMGPPAEIR